VGLMNIIKDMNQEQFEQTPMVYGGAINQNRRNLNVEIDRVRQKMAMGATFFFTQPVFNQAGVDILKKIKEETGARILCGIMPLVSLKNALFMKNEMTGIDVDDDVIRLYESATTKEEGERVGISIAKDVIERTADFVDGYYFTFPFNRVHMLDEILK
jgi:homocysteine S-methyltransferase